MAVGHVHQHHEHGGDHGPDGDDRMHMPRGLNLLLALILGLSAIATGVIAWHANVLAGHATEEFTLSTQAVSDANSLSQDAERASTGERSLFIAYRAARQAGNTTEAETIWSMMSASTRRAVAWWEAQPASERPLSPFLSANPDWDAPGTVIAAEAALARADDMGQSAHDALSQSHQLEFFAALLAVAFLAGGLSGVFESHRAKAALIATSGTVLVLCVVGAAVSW